MEGFPTPSLPKRADKPDYAAIKEIHQLLTANVALVESDLDGGQNGSLRIILPSMKYACISDTTFICPPKPGRMATVPAWTPPGE